MRRREFLSAGAGALVGVERPNVVLIVADDLGSADVGCYGAREIRTPWIDGLARSGVRFRQAYATPECTPTRTAILTGRYPQRERGLECAIGVGDVGRYDEAAELAGRGELGLRAERGTFVRGMKRLGYRTASIGKWHVGYREKFWPARQGFDVSEGVLGGNADYWTRREEDGRATYFEGERLAEREGHTTDVIAAAAVRFLKEQKRGNPFFLYLPFTAPHAPMQPGYRGLVEQMDARIGEVLKALDAGGHRERTAVVFCSDNGADANGSNAPLRGKKSSVFEGGIRVPMIVRWPGVARAGAEVGEPVTVMDLMPTFAGGAGPSDGVDLKAALRGSGGVGERALFWRYRRMKNVRKAARAGRWKLVHDNAERYLFDLGEDPLEKVNLYGERGGVVKEMEGRLSEWEREMGQA